MNTIEKFASDINTLMEKNINKVDLVHKLLTNILEDEFADEQLKTEYLKILIQHC
jgi:archaellum component FlaC